nr:PaRep2b protein [Pyrobaculum aerophilum]
MALSAFSMLGHAVAKEQVESAVLELRCLASYVQAVKADNYRRALEEASKAWHEQRGPTALWALRELGFKPSTVYQSGNKDIIIFKGDVLNNLLKALIPAFPKLYELRDALAEFAGAFKAVTNEVVRANFNMEWAYIAMAEGYLPNVVTVEGTLDTSGSLPKAIIRLRIGKVMAHMNMYWTGGVRAQFAGSRKEAERLASIIRALGGEVKTKQKRTGWVVQLNTDGITAIRHDKWLNAVRGFVEELYKNGEI